ncbi:hypothetical protein M231_05505 [Tremella mesenterica]|uniref:Uncharacterized protein n=1 Tax=Tremella mesenterica TaxID=5217 RepID=A0A4Q1BHV8_TREME|nr:hypothetical protein M231_05505 [Tremella mesenterica]
MASSIPVPPLTLTPLPPPKPNDPRAAEIPILEQLVNFPHRAFEIQLSDSQYPWEDIETSGRLITANPDFPRRFIHSNHLIDGILPSTLSRVCQQLEDNPVARGEVAYNLEAFLTIHRDSEPILISGDEELANYMSELSSCLLPPLTCTSRYEEELKRFRTTGKWRSWTLKEDRFVSNVYLRQLLKEFREETSKECLVSIKAIVEFRSGAMGGFRVFDSALQAIKVAGVRIGDDGRAVVTRKKIRKRLGRRVVDQVERLLTNVWCQMLHHSVRIAILTSHECTLAFYIHDNKIHVSDLIRPNDAAVDRPCRSPFTLLTSISLLDESDLALPPTHYFRDPALDGEPVFTHWGCFYQRDRDDNISDWWESAHYRPCRETFLPSHNLTFSNFIQPRDPSSTMTENDKTSCLAEDEIFVSQLGPPSLFVRLSPEYTFRRVKEEDSWHSLIRARRWPSLLHGPLTFSDLQGDRLPVLLPTPSRATPTSSSSKTAVRSPGISPAESQIQKPSLTFIPQLVVVGEQISWGAVWDVFRLTCPPESKPFPFPLIGKIICIECFEEDLDPDSLYDMWIRGGTTQVQVREQVKRDFQVLTELSALDPPIIPQVLGLWGGLQRGYQVWMMVMEDAGQSLNGMLSEDDM